MVVLGWWFGGGGLGMNFGFQFWESNFGFYWSKILFLETNSYFLETVFEFLGTNFQILGTNFLVCSEFCIFGNITNYCAREAGASFSLTNCHGDVCPCVCVSVCVSRKYGFWETDVILKAIHSTWEHFFDKNELNWNFDVILKAIHSTWEHFLDKNELNWNFEVILKAIHSTWEHFLYKNELNWNFGSIFVHTSNVFLTFWRQMGKR